MTRIVSSLPGRIRIRDKRLRDQSSLNELGHELLQIAAITQLKSDARTGSVVVNFDQDACDIGALETQLDAAVDAVLSGPPIAPLLTKKSLNRYNKIAMVGSLAASLAFAAAGKRHRQRLHVLTGYLFVANLGVHLYLYRKSLFR
jgi:hypothetical protein